MSDFKQSKSIGRWWIQFPLALVILALGAFGVMKIIKSKKPPKRRPYVHKGLLVEVLKVQAEDRKIIVQGHGQIRPRRELSISPQVPGRIIWVNKALVAGGLIRKGKSLVIIDPTDYRLAAKRAEASIALAEQKLAMAQSNARVARREWRVLGSSVGQGRPSALALHKPQLLSAKAALEGSKADRAQARANLSRTVIRAPFNLRVRRESVERGQYVTIGRELASVFSTDWVEVDVPLPLSDIKWLNVPLRDGYKWKKALKKRGRRGKNTVPAKKELSGSPAMVTISIGAEHHEKRGWVVRSLGEVDPLGRMTKVVLAIEDPYNLSRKGGKKGKKNISAESTTYKPVFEIGAFVDVSIEGRMVRNVIPIPNEAVRVGSKVWVLGPGNRLEIRPVEVIRMTEKEALVSSGLRTGDLIITTSIMGAVKGMKLRLVGEKQGDRLGNLLPGLKKQGKPLPAGGKKRGKPPRPKGAAKGKASLR